MKNGITTKCFHFLTNNFEWIAIPLLGAMILIGCLFPPKERVPSKDTILILRDSLKTSPSARDAHIQVLLTSIHQAQTILNQNAIASEGLKMQGRLLFITLFSALITALYSVKDEKHRRVIVFTALLVGFGWYGINVHKLDIENRGIPVVEIINNTEKELANMPPVDRPFYYLDHIKLVKVLDEGKKGHELRKIQRFFTPDFSDMVFNMTPMLIIAVVYRLRKRSNPAA